MEFRDSDFFVSNRSQNRRQQVRGCTKTAAFGLSDWAECLAVAAGRSALVEFVEDEQVRPGDYDGERRTGI